MRPLVVLPTFNEAPNIEEVLGRVRDAVPEAEILVVDDGSPDGTADLAEKAGTELGSISVHRRAGKSGLGSAYRDGFRYGLERGFTVLVEMDSDLSHDPAAAPRAVGRGRARGRPGDRVALRAGRIDPGVVVVPEAALTWWEPLCRPGARSRRA
ncbi:MAG: glycosyltransferase [Acidimicrobiia bacterium]|nr:glycosyltransferase [Acidimicrobiia bacterium]